MNHENMSSGEDGSQCKWSTYICGCEVKSEYCLGSLQVEYLELKEPGETVSSISNPYRTFLKSKVSVPDLHF